MARYIDADMLIERLKVSPIFQDFGTDGYFIRDMVIDLVECRQTADVVPRAECEKWYHEYHKIKENFKQEKEYHRSTEKLSDKYHTELQAAKAEVKRLDFDLDVEKMRRMADRERYEDRIRDIFGMLEMLMKKRVFPVVREGVIEVERDPFLAIDPQDYTRIKGMYIDGQSGTPVPTEEEEEGHGEQN